MKNFALNAVDAAVRQGASYADIRIVETLRENLSVRNGRVSEMDLAEDLGFGVRVLVDGAWGFASSARVNNEEIERVAGLAVRLARASATLKREDVRLAPEPAWRDTWITPCVIDPFTVPLSAKMALLHALDEELRRSSLIAAAVASMSFQRKRQWMATSEGSLIDQTTLRSGAGMAATAVEGDDVQVRSYPSSFGGQFLSAGYELVLGLKLTEHATRVREQAVELLSAPACPPGKRTLILESSQVALQIHESVGHASELDRVLGMEANFAGTSFATTDKLGSFQYGSPLVNLVCDNTIPGGLATTGYDDDAVRSQRWPIVQEGRFVGYQFNRELAHRIGAERSVGSCRAEGWSHVPIVRNSNLCLLPGDSSLEEMIAGTDDGVYMETNRSWSIDQKRLNFQFGCEAGWEIRNGKLGRMLKNPNYQGLTPDFWRSCDAVGDAHHWVLWGLPNCGKGQPMQVAEMSHGAGPARFREVMIGVGNQ
ncbi:MAG: TldD/PmbA family protein [Candidatus Zixiibacteriota bacterium]|nr:MAG: TldD/PmbA family protein [candidate division Zixibacteria bacterium]